MKLQQKTFWLAAVLVVAGIILGWFAVGKIREHRRWQWRVQEPTRELVNRTPSQVTLVRTKFAGARWQDGTNGFVVIAQSLKILLPIAYQTAPTRAVFTAPIPLGRYDCIVTGPDAMGQLRREIERQFQLTAHNERRPCDVWVLRVSNTNQAGFGLLPVSEWKGTMVITNGECTFTGVSMGYLAHILGLYLQTPVIDRTGLHRCYDFKFKFDWKEVHYGSMKRDLQERLGLELVRSREELDVLVVERVKPTEPPAR